MYAGERLAGAHLHGDGEADAGRNSGIGEDGRVEADDVAGGVLLGGQYNDSRGGDWEKFQLVSSMHTCLVPVKDR